MPVIEEGRIAKVDADNRLAFGWVYISHDATGLPIVDKEGDFIAEVGQLEKAAYDFMLDSRSGDLWHDEVKIATCIESVVFTPEKIEAMGLQKADMPQGAWWAGWYIEDDGVWDEVKSGRLASFSMGGRGKRTSLEHAS